MIINQYREALIIQRRDTSHWEPPGGVLEAGETIDDGLKREVREETGLFVDPVCMTGVYKNMSHGVVALVYECVVTGGQLSENDEAQAFRWVTEEEVPELMTEAFAVRVLDALHHKRDVPTRAHDGVHVL